MARYRKIDTRIWNDEKFRAFSDDAQLAFFFVLTHPSMTALGAMRGTIAGLAAEKGWQAGRFADAIRDGIREGMLEVNEKACFIAARNFLRYNQPEGPNSVSKAWVEALDLIPECPEKRVLIARCRNYLDGRSKEFRDALPHGIWDAFRVGMSDAKSDASPIQEQEQEQEPEQERAGCVAASATPAAPIIDLPLNNGTEYQITSDMVQEWVGLYPAVDVLQELRNMRGWLLANKSNRKTTSGILRFVTGWLVKEQNQAPRSVESSAKPKHSVQPVRLEYNLPLNLDEDAGREVWNETLQKLSKRVNRHSFDTWLKPIKAAGISGDVLYLTIPTSDFSHVHAKYGSLLLEVLAGRLKVELISPQEIAC
jgi:DnaA N-terminal domain